MSRRAKDARLFARIDLDYADHPKIAGLSDAAFRAHIEMILYSRKYLTDGRIAKRLANRFGTESVRELLSNDEATPSLIELPDGDYLLHGYVDMQETKAEVARRSATNRRNGALGGRKSVSDSPADSVSDSVSETKASRVAETETETETEKTTPNGVVARKRATRIPEPFIVSKEMREWAAEEVPGVDVDGSTRKFVDYWRAESGAKASKKDWTATWRNWLRRDHERTPANGTGRAPTGIDRTYARQQQNLAVVQHFTSLESQQGEITA